MLYESQSAISNVLYTKYELYAMKYQDFNSFCKYKNIWPKSNVWQRKMKNKVALFNGTKGKRVYLCKRHQKSQYF